MPRPIMKQINTKRSNKKKSNMKRKKNNCAHCVNPGRLEGLPITQPGGSRLASISHTFEMVV